MMDGEKGSFGLPIRDDYTRSDLQMSFSFKANLKTNFIRIFVRGYLLSIPEIRCLARDKRLSAEGLAPVATSGFFMPAAIM